MPWVFKNFSLACVPSLPFRQAISILGTDNAVCAAIADATGVDLVVAPLDKTAGRVTFFLTHKRYSLVQTAFKQLKQMYLTSSELSLEVRIGVALRRLHQLRMIEIVADGNCLYRSLALATLGSQARHMTLRRQIVDQLRATKEIWEFLGEEAEAYLK
jgi:hypothetical protein